MDGLVTSAIQFEADCGDILRNLSTREIESVEIMDGGKTIGMLTAPPKLVSAGRDIYGWMAGTVNLPEGLDLTEPVLDEPFDAEQGILHR
jgi:hypothetical protein